MFCRKTQPIQLNNKTHLAKENTPIDKVLNQRKMAILKFSKLGKCVQFIASISTNYE
jgi:hypothetical protein